MQLKNVKSQAQGMLAKLATKEPATGGIRGVGIGYEGMAQSSPHYLLSTFEKEEPKKHEEVNAISPHTMQYTGSAVSLWYQQGLGTFGSSIPRFRDDHMTMTNPPGQFLSDGNVAKIAPGHY